jgi:hypothetical protein
MKLRALAFIMTAAFVAGQTLPAAAAVSNASGSRSKLADTIIVPAQQRDGPGRGTGTGPGRGTRRDSCPDRCRTVVEPGSGRGPQEVCERVLPKCRTVVEPGSGKGPQEVCECP